MDFMSIILIVVLVYVAKPAFLGTGKLMQLENIKEGKEKIAKKGLRISYLILFFCALFMIAITQIQSRGFNTNYKVTFSEEYTYATAEGTTVYTPGQDYYMTTEELTNLYYPETTTATETTAAEATATEATAIEATAETTAAPTAEATAAPTATAAPASALLSCMPTTTTSTTKVDVPCKYVANYECAADWAKKIPGEDGNAKWKFVRTISVILFAISVADIAFLMIFSNKMTDKAKREKKQAVAAGNRVPGMPKGAFNFDADEPFAADDPKVSDSEGK